MFYLFLSINNICTVIELSNFNKYIILKTFYFLIIFSYFYTLSYSQQRFIKGYVYDLVSKEALIGASVYLKEDNQGTNTNNSGFFTLEVSKVKSKILSISYIGYQSKEYSIIQLSSDSVLIAYLENANNLNEVIVKARDESVQNFQDPASILSINADQIKKTPQLFGEVDVLKTLQLMPGIKGGSEGQTGIYVRGGGPDQNLILVDGVPVYNVSHLFGFFSVFNADAIQNVNVYKGGFPARYGGRLSSVIDLSLKDGNKEKIHGEGSLGLISSKFMLEGPILKGKTSFLVAARRTYIDALISPIAALSSGGNVNAGYYFYDLNLKFNHRINNRNSLSFSSYLGDDKFYVNSKASSFSDSKEETRANLTWGNKIATLQWNHVLKDNIFVNTSISYSRYNFNVGIISESGGSILKEGKENFRLIYNSGIDDFILNHHYEHNFNNKHLIRYGFKSIYHIFNSGTLQNKINFDDEASQNIDTTIGKPSYGIENNIFFEHEWQPNHRLKFNNGLHWNSFLMNGKFYQLPQPRISARYLITENTNIRASFSTMMQNIHLLSTNNIGLPTEIWVPATQHIQPQTSWQISTGLSQFIYNRKFEVSMEAYYKRMKNTIDYLDGASFIAPGQDWQNVVDQGKGWAYGVETLVQKKQGKTTGWVGYTLSWAYRQYPNINFGNIFPYRFDRRHDVSVVLHHTFNKKWDIGATWVYNTGNSVSLIQSVFGSAEIINGSVNQSLGYYSSRNSFKMPSYHRLDLSINFRKQRRWGESKWNFSIYNMYARQNAFYIFFSEDENGDNKLYSISLFSIIPSISYGYKF